MYTLRANKYKKRNSHVFHDFIAQQEPSIIKNVRKNWHIFTTLLIFFALANQSFSSHHHSTSLLWLHLRLFKVHFYKFSKCVKKLTTLKYNCCLHIKLLIKSWMDLCWVAASSEGPFNKQARCIAFFDSFLQNIIKLIHMVPSFETGCQNLHLFFGQFEPKSLQQPLKTNQCTKP